MPLKILPREKINELGIRIRSLELMTLHCVRCALNTTLILKAFTKNTSITTIIFPQ